MLQRTLQLLEPWKAARGVPAHGARCSSTRSASMGDELDAASCRAAALRSLSSAGRMEASRAAPMAHMALRVEV